METGVLDGVVDERVAAHFGDEPRSREDGHDGKRSEGLSDLLLDLVLEVFGVFERCFIEDEQVADGREREIHHEPEEPIPKLVSLLKITVY